MLAEKRLLLSLKASSICMLLQSTTIIKQSAKVHFHIKSIITHFIAIKQSHILYLDDHLHSLGHVLSHLHIVSCFWHFF